MCSIVRLFIYFFVIVQCFFMSELKVTIPQEIRDYVKLNDKDRDGRLSFAEAEGSLTYGYNNVFGRRDFDLLDKDKDGFLTPEELVALMRRMPV